MKKLAEIQQKLKAKKSQRNTFGNYNYRSCEDILEAVKPLLGDAILTITDDMVVLGDRYYVKATVTLHLDPHTKSVSAFAREPLIQKGMGDAQITGATSSYARKYALNGLFCIDDAKDADSQDNREPKKTPPPAKPVRIKANPAQQKHLGSVFELLSKDVDGKTLDKAKYADAVWILLGKKWPVSEADETKMAMELNANDFIKGE